MVIRVSEIPEEGLRFGGPEAFPEPFQDRAWRLEDVELAVEKDGDVVFVHGRIRSRVPQVCSRCLEVYEATMEANVETRLVPAPRARGPQTRGGRRSRAWPTGCQNNPQGRAHEPGRGATNSCRCQSDAIRRRAGASAERITRWPRPRAPSARSVGK